jgi:hypothetical protein
MYKIGPSYIPPKIKYLLAGLFMVMPVWVSGQQKVTLLNQETRDPVAFANVVFHEQQ